MNAPDEAMTIEHGRELLAQAKARLRACHGLAFFNAAFETLQRQPDDGEEWYLRKPHVWFLIAKWGLANWRPNDDRPVPVDDDINFVGQSIWDAMAALNMPGAGEAIFARRLFLQQIWFQRRFDPGSLARQHRILGEMLANSVTAARFAERHQLTPAHFVRQLAYLAADSGDALQIPGLSQQRPAGLRDLQHWEVIRRHFSRPVADLHRIALEAEQRNTPPEVEVCEQSPFIATPFLLAQQGPVCIHHKLLFQTLGTAVFDLARAPGARAFMNEFGPAFENYIAEVLEDLAAPVIRETELEERLQGEGNVVDFALPADGALVLLDAKGIEGHYEELYHNLPAVLAERMKLSLLRAVDQAVNSASRLPEDLRRNETYFVCVTFKQLLVTDGLALRELVAGTADGAGHARWDSVRLPPGHMVFVSIFELEQLVSLAVARGVPLGQILREITTANGIRGQRKALVEQHVMAQQVNLRAPRTLQQAAERMCTEP